MIDFIIRFFVEGGETLAYKTDTGIILRNPAEKTKRYARQMSSGVVRETGKELTSSDFAYRAGYLDARKDSAKAYCSNNGIKSKAKKRKR